MPTPAEVSTQRKTYQRLCRQLAAIEWICQGSVMERTYHRPAKKGMKTYGPYYSWTRKVNNKTKTAALSPPQYRILSRAIDNHRQLEVALDKMRTISELIIFSSTLGVSRRNR